MQGANTSASFEDECMVEQNILMVHVVQSDRRCRIIEVPKTDKEAKA